MAKRPRLFSTASVVTMRDAELTGQEWRVYLWVSLHDGMSMLKGKGAGCFTSNLKLAEQVQCDYSSLCRSLSKLVERGHLVREKMGKTTTYRATFPEPDNLQDCNISPSKSGAIACKAATDDDGIACKVANEGGSTTCNEILEKRRKLPKTAEDYSPLSGELYSAEAGRLDSAKLRHEISSTQPSLSADNTESAWQWDHEAGDSGHQQDPSSDLTEVQKIRVVLARYERDLKANPAKLDLQSKQASLYTLHIGMLEKDAQAASWALRLYEQTWEAINSFQRRDTGGVKSIGNVVGR